VRPFNTYGPRQSARAVIPTIITQALAGGTVTLGNLGPTRDFTYVSDTVEGFILAAASDSAVGTTFNLGTSGEISIGDLAMKIGRLMGKTLDVKQRDERVRAAGSEVERLISDNRLARELTGWKPSVPLDDGLKRTIDWIGGHLDLYQSGKYAI
jgi:dTDP-glucose 4,6-dehydratase